MILGIFWNPAERRLRAFWRIAVATVVFIVATIAVSIPFVLLFSEEQLDLLAGQLVVCLALLISLPFAIRFLDRRKFSDTGVYFDRGWWIDLGYGMFLGAAAMSLIFLTMLAVGWVTINETFYVESGAPIITALFSSMVLFLAVGVSEELIFRGYLLLNIAEGLNSRFLGPKTSLTLSWVLTSAMFGVGHIFNPDATLSSSLNITLAGIWLGLGYVLTGSLAIPIGLHITWNFFQGIVFGLPVSGTNDFEPRLLVTEDTGPEIWTGGTFGPENGLLGTIALVIGTVLVAAWIRFRQGPLTFHTEIAEPPVGLVAPELPAETDLGQPPPLNRG